MIKEEIKINGMSCSHCVKSVEDALSVLPIENYQVKIGHLNVEYNKDKISIEQIINAVEYIGYRVIKSN